MLSFSKNFTELHQFQIFCYVTDNKIFVLFNKFYLFSSVEWPLKGKFIRLMLLRPHTNDSLCLSKNEESSKKFMCQIERKE